MYFDRRTSILKRPTQMENFLIVLALVSAVQAQPLRDASVAKPVNQFAPTSTRSLRNLAPEKHPTDLVTNFDSAKLKTSGQPLLEKLAEALSTSRAHTALGLLRARGMESAWMQAGASQGQGHYLSSY